MLVSIINAHVGYDHRDGSEETAAEIGGERFDDIIQPRQ
jgi:hypothetical protein